MIDLLESRHKDWLYNKANNLKKAEIKMHLYTKTTTPWSLECEQDGKTVARAFSILKGNSLILPVHGVIYTYFKLGSIVLLTFPLIGPLCGCLSAKIVGFVCLGSIFQFVTTVVAYFIWSNTSVAVILIEDNLKSKLSERLKIGDDVSWINECLPEGAQLKNLDNIVTDEEISTVANEFKLIVAMSGLLLVMFGLLLFICLSSVLCEVSFSQELKHA